MDNPISEGIVEIDFKKPNLFYLKVENKSESCEISSSFAGNANISLSESLNQIADFLEKLEIADIYETELRVSLTNGQFLELKQDIAGEDLVTYKISFSSLEDEDDATALTSVFAYILDTAYGLKIHADPYAPEDESILPFLENDNLRDGISSHEKVDNDYLELEPFNERGYHTVDGIIVQQRKFLPIQDFIDLLQSMPEGVKTVDLVINFEYGYLRVSSFFAKEYNIIQPCFNLSFSSDLSYVNKIWEHFSIMTGIPIGRIDHELADKTRSVSQLDQIVSDYRKKNK